MVKCRDYNSEFLFFMLRFVQKEPALNVKMRRDGTMTVVNVKVERTSTDAADKTVDKSKADKSKVTASTTITSVDSESIRPVRIKKEKVDEPIISTSKATSSKTTKGSAENEVPKKNASDDLNDSLEILPMDTNQPIDLVSDDETDGDKNEGSKMMPPPSFVPPAKLAKEKKAPVEKKVRSTRSKQTKRKV